MKLRVLIVDDEKLSRDRVRRFLGAEPGTEVVGECGNGTEAVTAIRQKIPDLVFLDVKMPELDGFGVLEALQGAHVPAIIFVTAYSQFAVQAFENHAVDYLLKPFDRARFQTALHRARERLHRHSFNSQPPSLSLPPPAPKELSDALERIPVRSHGRISFVQAGEIDWIAAADNYAELHVGNRAHLVRMTITAVVNRLPKNRFARISRSIVVNLDRIQEIRPKSHGDYLIVLQNGTLLAGTRNYRHTLTGSPDKPR